MSASNQGVVTFMSAGVCQFRTEAVPWAEGV